MTQSANVASTEERNLLRAFVPFNALTDDHISVMLRDRCAFEHICRGQVLFSSGDYDNVACYLVAGQVVLNDGEQRRVVHAGSPEAAMPLGDERPRRETAVAVTDCTIARFDRDWLEGIVCWDQAAHYIILDICGSRDLDEDAEWMVTLLRSNLFYKVPPVNIREVLSRFSPVLVEAGQVVVRQGEIGDCCYVIKEGEAEVTRSTDGRSRPQRLAILGPGRCFGEDALLLSNPRNATVTMLGNGVLMRLDKQDFYTLLREPKVAALTLDELAMEDDLVWLDVRTSEEYEEGHRSGCMQMPLRLLKLKSRMLDPSRRYVAYCDTGRRSVAAAHLLQQDGFNVVAMRGGIKGLPLVQRSAFSALAE